MNFTYESYKYLIELLLRNEYYITTYNEFSKDDKRKLAILRHDIDNCIQKSLSIAEIEAKHNCKATYFFLLRTNFYNVAAKEMQEMIKKIVSMGHDIGLHFDETAYSCEEINESIDQLVWKEANILSDICNIDISTVAFHRPSSQSLNMGDSIGGLINSYGPTYFKEFKYVSDSRRNWREPVIEIIESGKYNHLHVLTHPFLYYDKEKDLRETMMDFIDSAKKERYMNLYANVRCFDEIVDEKEI